MNRVKFAYLIEPPFNFQDEEGRVTGCDVKLARHIFDRLGIDHVEFVEAQFSDLLPGLTHAKWQMTTGLFVTFERQKHALFSRPIWALPDGLLIRLANVGKFTGYHSLAKCSSARLAVIRDQVQHQNALSLGVPTERVIIFETYADAAGAVLDGRVDAYVSVARAHESFIAQNPELDLRVVPIPAAEKAPAYGCFAFGKADAAFRKAVDDVLASFLCGAEHRSLMREFGFSDAEVDLLVV